MTSDGRAMHILEKMRCLGNLRWVIAALAPGVASANAPKTPQDPANNAVPVHRLDEIGAAARLKAAMRSQKWANGELVHAGRHDQQPPGNGRDHAENASTTLKRHTVIVSIPE